MKLGSGRTGEINILKRTPPAFAGTAIRHTAETRRPVAADAARFEIDASGFITDWSGTAEQLYGFDLHEIVGLHVSSLYCLGDLKAGKAAYEISAATTRGNYFALGWQRRKNGQQFWSYSESTKTKNGFAISVSEVPLFTLEIA
ncbi:MAG: PAS domain-containing protein [Candidatus Obscuribacterales bacterium]|nr:PAS domain-containing protein [Candidatus Obscuribacterales bacterium]